MSPHILHGCAGEYRNSQQRLTNNAESVAFYGGISKEGSLITSRFRQLVKHQAHLLRTQWRFSMWQVCHLRGHMGSADLFAFIPA